MTSTHAERQSNDTEYGGGGVSRTDDSRTTPGVSNDTRGDPTDREREYREAVSPTTTRCIMHIAESPTIRIRVYSWATLL